MRQYGQEKYRRDFTVDMPKQLRPDCTHDVKENLKVRIDHRCKIKFSMHYVVALKPCDCFCGRGKLKEKYSNYNF